MATFSSNNYQYTGEKRTYTVDFTDNLATGITVTAGTAIHIPPSGTASTPTVTVASPYLYVALTNPTPVGNHYIDVIATLSDGDKPTVRIAVNVLYPATTAREGMLDLITQVRSMTDAGINEYVIAGIPYWDDAQIQTVMDKHRTDIKREALIVIPEYTTAGTVLYKEYVSGHGYLEQGTAYHFLQDGAFNTASTADYSVDYNKGIIAFTASQPGSAYYMTGRAYDLDAAAADIWRAKAGHAARMYSFSTDNHRFERGQYIKNCMDMAKIYDSNAGIKSGDLIRCDNVS